MLTTVAVVACNVCPCAQIGMANSQQHDYIKSVSDGIVKGWLLPTLHTLFLSHFCLHTLFLGVIACVVWHVQQSASSSGARPLTW
jgi:hypothetical protein